MDALNAWSTLALAAIAGIALLGARGQIQEARRLRKSTSRAYVTVHAEGDKETRTLNLFVTNAGRTHAEDVKITFEPPLEAAADHLDHQKTASFWKQPVIPPGKKLFPAQVAQVEILVAQKAFAHVLTFSGSTPFAASTILAWASASGSLPSSRCSAGQPEAHAADALR